MSSNIVCSCNLVRVKEIEALMCKEHYLLEDIANITGASKSCGRCKPILQRIVNEHKASLACWQTSIDWDLVTTLKREIGE